MIINDKKLDSMLEKLANPEIDGAFEQPDTVRRSASPRRAVAAAAAAAVLLIVAAGAFIIARFAGGSGVNPGTVDLPDAAEISGTGAVTGAPGTSDAEPGVPTEPEKKVTVYTILSLNPLGSGLEVQAAGNVTRYLSGISGSVIERITDGRYVCLTNAELASEHAGHGNLIYDAVKDSVFCPSCTVNALSARTGLKAGERAVADSISTAETVSFAVWNDAEKAIVRRYLYFVADDALKEIPAPSKNDFGLIEATGDFGYILTHSYRESDAEYDDVYVVDTRTGGVAKVSGDYPTFMLSRFTPDGQFVLSALRYEGAVENFESENCRFIASDVRGQLIVECRGRAVWYDSCLLLTRDSDSRHRLYDLAAGKEIDIPQDLRYFDLSEGKLLLWNACSGAFRTVETGVSAGCLSEDGQRIFTYSEGQNYVVCRGLDGKRYEVELDDAFTGELASLSATCRISFMLEKSGDRVILLYRTLETETGTEPAEQPQRSDRDLVAAVLKENQPTSISVFMALLGEKYPGHEFDVTASCGSGYTVLYVDGRTSYKDAYALIEDYRDGYFYAYIEGRGHGFARELSYAPGTRCRYPLEASQYETAVYLREKGIPTVSADIDYAIFRRDGVYSEELTYDYMFSEEYSKKIGFFYAFREGTGYEISSEEYLDRLAAFLEELGSCGRQRSKLQAEDNYTHFGQVTTDTRLNLRAAKDKAGNSYVRVGAEIVYLVPEEVFNDLVALADSALESIFYRPAADDEDAPWISITVPEMN
ncbi:MAG: hypothetical protein ILO42_08300 [Clostridia bacterium]|nr:hypothetical protein [Clostridia bacterium]